MLDSRLDIRFSSGTIHIDLPVLTPGKIVTVYGQQEVVKDLIAARLSRGVSHAQRQGQWFVYTERQHPAAKSPSGWWRSPK